MKRFLILENGQIFEGKAFGADGEVVAEIVFSTAMVGYIGTLTDLSYAGQAVVQTFPMMGNYGMISTDVSSELTGPSAYIVREWCSEPSNFRMEGDIDKFLKEKGIVGLCGIDTRALTRVIRENGVMNGVITDTPDPKKAELAKKYAIKNPVQKVTAKSAYTVKAEDEKYKVTLLDLGLRKSEINSLVQRGCTVTVLPANATCKEILATSPDGVFLTNGPGDPKDNKEIIKNIKEFLESKIPTMGICLGHQILALANGFDTYKLKYGHRGSNQPVRSDDNGRTYISTQNHGYAVDNDSVDQTKAKISYKNVNDGSNEGLEYLKMPVFSVQFHPEACSQPNDTSFLYNKFIDIMEERKCR